MHKKGSPQQIWELFVAAACRQVAGMIQMVVSVAPISGGTWRRGDLRFYCFTTSESSKKHLSPNVQN